MDGSILSRKSGRTGTLVFYAVGALGLAVFGGAMCLRISGPWLAYIGILSLGLLASSVLLWYRQQAGALVWLLVSVLLVASGAYLKFALGGSGNTIGMMIGGVVGIPGFWILRSEVNKSR